MFKTTTIFVFFDIVLPGYTGDYAAINQNRVRMWVIDGGVRHHSHVQFLAPSHLHLLPSLFVHITKFNSVHTANNGRKDTNSDSVINS